MTSHLQLQFLKGVKSEIQKMKTAVAVCHFYQEEETIKTVRKSTPDRPHPCEAITLL